MSDYSVVYFCTVHGWFYRHHFYQGLATRWARTRPLLYVSAPIPWPGGRLRGEGGRWVGGGYLYQPDRGLWVLEPVNARGVRYRTIRRLGDILTARATVAAIAATGFDADRLLVCTYSSGALALLDRLPGACSAYLTFDEVVDPREPELLRRVDHVFGHSPAAVARNQWLGEKVSAMTTAIDPEPFIAARARACTPADLAALARPLVGYGGALSRRIDWRILKELAKRTQGTLVLVGPVVDEEGAREVEELTRSPNVAWVGHRGPLEAPHYIAAFDVGLVPYKRNAFNDGSNPVKFFEYLAAGVPVISVPLPALTGFDDVALFADDGVQFVAAVNAAVSQSVDTETVRRRQKVARAHSYDHLISRIEERVSSGARSQR